MYGWGNFNVNFLQLMFFLPLITFLQLLAFNSIHCLYLHQKLCVNFCIRHDTSSSLQNFRVKLVSPPQMILGSYAHGYVICYCLDKSDRIGIETCSMFHDATVSSSDIFGTALSIAIYCSIASKLSRQSFFVRKIERTVPKISEDDIAAQWYCHTICLTGNQFFYNTIRFVLTANYDTEVHWSNSHVICVLIYVFS